MVKCGSHPYNNVLLKEKKLLQKALKVCKFKQIIYDPKIA